MRRGGIHAARRTLCRWPLPVCMVFALHCRAGVHARRTDDFLKFYNVRRGQDPALQSGGNGRVSHKPRAMAHPCRAACMPPLQTPGIASMIPGTDGGGRFTGRMHAAPTNQPGTAGEWGKAASAISVHGGRKRPPYRTGKTSRTPRKTCIFMQEHAPAAAHPVRIPKNPLKMSPPLCALPLAFWKICCIIYNIE